MSDMLWWLAPLAVTVLGYLWVQWMGSGRHPVTNYVNGVAAAFFFWIIAAAAWAAGITWRVAVGGWP